METIDAYIEAFHEETRLKLQEVRQAIQKAVPEAEEAWSYQMPTFKLRKKNLAHFAAWKGHLGLYPGPAALEAFKTELSRYNGSKGAVQFPLNEPMPLELIKSIVRWHAERIK
jgi:uncharacterized protein YdhG (YjbR/CyaY superfamily)